MGRLKLRRPSYADRVLREARSERGAPPATRLVPSKRGLLTVFLAAAAAGAGAGALVFHFFGPLCR